MSSKPSFDKLRTPAGSLIVRRQSPALKERLWQLVREAKGGDVLAPVTVIGPSRYANLSLRQELGRSGFANVRFIGLSVLSDMLGAPALTRAGRKPLTSVLEGVFVRSVLTQAAGPLTPVKDHPSTLSSVRSSFRELRKADDAILESLATQGGVRGELVNLYREFRRRTENTHYDAHDLAESAAAAVRGGANAGLDDLGIIIFYLPRNLAPADAGLIGELARQGRCAVILGTTGDESADSETFKLSQRLQVLTGAPQSDDSEDVSPLRESAQLHIAPNAHEELRWVIRQIVQEARENRTPFHRMAVLYRTDNPYGSLIRDELRLAGIPAAGPSRDTLADTAVGRTLTGLLTLPDRDFQRGDVMAWLTGCPVQPPAGRTPGFNPSRWDSVTRKAGIVGGLDQWRRRLEGYAERLREDAAHGEQAEEISEARASAMRAEAASAQNALAFVNQLAEDLTPSFLRKQEPDTASWSEFATWAVKLMGLYLDHGIPDSERTARDRILETLEHLKGAESVDPSTTMQVFRQTVEEALAAPIGHQGVTGQGVFVSAFSAASGMDFDAVWLVGMIEGTTPPVVRPDPLLPEANWREAGGESRREERIAKERYDYLSAVASAERRVLSFPVADASSQREAFPSRWFLEQASALEGTRVNTGDLPRLHAREWLSVNQSAIHALSGLSENALADCYDYNRNRLLEWRNDGKRLSEHPLAQQGTLAGSTRQARMRSQARLTEFDGNLSGAAPASKYVARLKEAPVSATSLESWAACPFRYFLGHVLRLSALETPEDITTISARDRGTMVHEILKRFLDESVLAAETPAPGESWSPESRQRLMRIAEEEFQKTAAKGIVGSPLLWRLTMLDVRDDLEAFLEDDAAVRVGHGTARTMAEAAFGFGGDSPTVHDPETGMPFRGRIDRLDLNEDGSSALVIDYKTGSASPYRKLADDAIDQGKRLQLGVYSLAARSLSPGAREVRAAYWFTTTGAGARFAPPDYFNLDDGEVGERFRKAVSTIQEGIRNGVFPANPGPMSSRPGRSGPENCLYCDYNSLCPSRRIDLWERKQSDPLVSGYLSLAGDGPTDEDGEESP